MTETLLDWWHMTGPFPDEEHFKTVQQAQLRVKKLDPDVTYEIMKVGVECLRPFVYTYGLRFSYYAGLIYDQDGRRSVLARLVLVPAGDPGSAVPIS